MESFSERHGLEPKREPQVDCMDGNLRRGIMDVVYTHFSAMPVGKIWTGWLKLSMYEWGYPWNYSKSYAESKVMEKCRACPYNQMYDLIELIVSHVDKHHRAKFVCDMNGALAENMSAWRIEGGAVVRVMADEEIGAVREAASISRENADYAKRVLRAIGPSDPDFENAIAQAAKMAENTMNMIVGRGNGLKSKLGSVVGKLDIPENLVESFKQVDTFANEFARHPHDKSTYEADRNDATLVLVWFSAMSNYLHWRWRDRGGQRGPELA